MRVFNRILDHIEEWLIASFIAAATLVIFAAVVHRQSASFPWLWKYAAKLDFSWAQELCIYLFIWMAKFGAAYGVRTGIHIGVDVLVNAVRPAWKRVLVTVALSLGAFFTAVIAIMGARWVLFIHGTGQISPDLEWPMWVIYLCIPLGSSLMCYRFLQVLVRFLRTGTLPAHTITAAAEEPA
ncbi:MAG TPA: TRAP transporter small permease [Burkholderiales bacterium]|nr:TRAP transporter small permease [Burkholderiales bacterium]